MENTDLGQLYQLMSNFKTEMKDDISNLKLSNKDDINNLKIEIAIIHNTQEQTRNDVIVLKNDLSAVKKDLSDIKQNNSENKGEKNRNNWFMDKFAIPIIMLIVSIFINMAIINAYKPTPNTSQQTTQTQQTQQVKIK